METRVNFCGYGVLFWRSTFVLFVAVAVQCEAVLRGFYGWLHKELHDQDLPPVN
jgi:hypothetical protein